MLKSELQSRAAEFLGAKKIDKVYAVIDGTHMMLNEFEVRYLQAQCALAPDFDEFCKRVIIYNGPDKTCPKFHFERSGRFEEMALNGFYNACAKMVFTLSRVERNINPGTFNLY